MNLLYRVVTNYFVCGIIVKNNKVIEAAPIMSWSIGKDLSVIEKWIKSKKGSIECRDK